MSRSRKKLAIVKASVHSNGYWKTIRSRIKTKIKSHTTDLEELELPNAKTIINDYDYCDWIYMAEYAKPTRWTSKKELELNKIKLKRK